MKDIQNEKDFRNIPLNKVGVSNVRYPILLKNRENGLQHTIGTVNMFVNLPEDFRGTHMSRFIEILGNHANKMNLQNVREILEDMKVILKASEAHMEMSFPYALEKTAPVTKIESSMVIDCSFIAALTGDKNFSFTLGVSVPVQTLCPCSKAISDYGAHNQRAIVNIRIKSKKRIWIETLVEIAESASSSPVYPLLKRSDEKYVTEKAYDNPKFVEDVARDAAIGLNKLPEIEWYQIEVSSEESIHNHNAYACIEWRCRENEAE